MAVRDFERTVSQCDANRKLIVGFCNERISSGICTESSGKSPRIEAQEPKATRQSRVGKSREARLLKYREYLLSDITRAMGYLSNCSQVGASINVR